MIGLLVAASLAAATPSAASATIPTREPSGPAIFVVRNADTTIYIFGTFHALDARSEWLDAPVKDAFERSDELVLETLVPQRPDDGASPPIRSSTLAVTRTASFLAGARSAISASRSQGMEVANGADMVLRRAAEAEGKQVESLETLDSQLTMFTRIPAAPEVASSASVSGGVAASMAEMQAAWKRGDQNLFVRLLSQFERTSPNGYRLMFTERNTRWADWIRARMQTPGTVFVAVGAGHLAGKDSVLVKLAQLGIASQRVY